MRHVLISILALAALGAIGCPKRLPDVMIDGQQLPYEQAAQKKYDIAEGLFKQEKADQAQTAYEVFLVEFAKSKLADDALYRLGQIHESRGDLNKAARNYQRAVVEFAGDRSVDARFRLGMVGARLGRHDEVVSVLKTVEKKLRGTQRQIRLWAVMGESLHALDRKTDAAVYWLRLAGTAQDSALSAWLRDRAASAIELEDNRKVLGRIANEFRDDPVAPRIVTRLAEVRFLEHDYTGAGKAARAVVARFPNHPAAERARRIVESVEASEKADPRTIGVAVPLTGPYAGFGQKALQSLLLSASVFGPDTGQRFRIAVRDTRGEGALAARAIEELYIQERAMAVIGGLLTEESEAAAARAQALGIPFITLAQKKTPSDEGDFIFRNSLTSRMQTKAIAAFAFDKIGAKRFAILYPDSPYGIELMHLFWDEVDRRGGEVVAIEKYEPDAADFRKPVEYLVGRHRDFIGAREEAWRRAKIKAREQGKKSWDAELPPVVDFDAVFIPDNFKPAAQALGFFALADAPIGRYRPKGAPAIIPLGIHSWNNPGLVERGGRYVEGAYFVDAFYPESQAPEVKDFVQRFVGTYLRVPDVLDALSFDSAELLFAQITAGANTRKKLRSSLSKLEGWKGAAGVLSFDKSGEPERILTVLTVQRKEIQPVRTHSAKKTEP